MISLETARLRLRPFVIDDAEAAFEWFGDPRVMKYYPGGAHRTVDETRKVGFVETHRATVMSIPAAVFRLKVSHT